MSQTPRARTMAAQRLANAVVRGLLRVPLFSAVIGKRMVTLYVVGRKTSRRYAIPVAYTAVGDDLLFGTPFRWGRNLRTGEQIMIVYKGKRRLADVVAFTDEESVVREYTVITRDNRTFAKFNKIGFDVAGNPEPADLRLAFAAGARAFRLTPR